MPAPQKCFAILALPIHYPAPQLAFHTFPKQRWSLFPVSQAGPAAGLVCDPPQLWFEQGLCAPDSAAELCTWSNTLVKPLHSPPAPLRHVPAWILRTVKQGFLQVAWEEIWKICSPYWPGLFHPASHLCLGSLSTSIPHQVPTGRAVKGETSSCSSKGRRSHSCPSRCTVPMRQKLNGPKKSTPMAKTFIKKNKDLKSVEQCDQLAFFCLVDLF